MSLFQPKALELPFEVIDMIVNWLHRRGDLLSLALSHSKFYHAIVPDHLHYRQVDFCISDYAMWSHLLEDSHRLAKLEVLNLSARFQLRAPPIKNPSVDEQNMLDHAAKVDSDLIQNAFKGMRRLHTVVWDSDMPLEGGSRNMSLPIYMWEAIHRYCPTVQKVDILGSLNCWRCFSPNVSEPTCSLENLSGISAFTYQASCFRHIRPGNTSLSFLSSFQRLQHLTLFRSSLWTPTIHYILSMKFPLLESLTVDDYLHVTSTVILGFLAVHPLLHTLKWSTHRGKIITDDSNTSDIVAGNVAPHLKILNSPPDLVQLLFQPSSNAPGSRRSLRSLCTSLPLDTQGPPEDIALLSRVGSGLEELTVGDGLETVKWRCLDLGDALRIISSAFPNLRNMDFGSVCIINYRTPTGTPRPKVHDWMSALSGLSHLVVLTIPWSQAEKNGFKVRASPSKKRHQTMGHFLTQCPRLRFLFCQQSEVMTPRQKVAILIGHRDTDIRFRNGRLIDAGAHEDRVWAAYEGKRSHLTEEISIALNASHGNI
ncbi:hypothetical protein FRC04_007218 [Tulasnella sp. 424]|nr:hypothetical protein FRC04_007218 [Tulasnella sp. 424]KAG8959739.1 hypothetical protein FRC05_007581 [Tulasnella sp. 425]